MSSLVESTMIYIWSGDLGMQQECGNPAAGPTQSSPFVFGVGTHHCKSVPAVGAGRFTSGLSRQAQMCCILVQGPHQPNV